MALPARPSDVYRPPGGRTDVGPDEDAEAERGTEAGGSARRARHRWRGPVAAGVAVLVVTSGLVLGPDDPRSRNDEGPAAAAAVDVAVEDAVVALLQLFSREAEAAELLRSRTALLSSPGPAATAADLAAARRQLDAALDEGRLLRDPGPAAAAYLRADGHRGLLLVLAEAAVRAEDIAVLAAVHDMHDADSAAAADDRQQLAARFGPDAQPELRRWAAALSAGPRGGATAAADAARAEVLEAWAAFAAAPAPAATDRLRDFLETVAPSTLDALAGHPVAGPALARLGHGHGRRR